MLYLLVVVETVHFSLPSKVPDPGQVPVQVAKKRQFLRTGSSASRGPPRPGHKVVNKISAEGMARSGANEFESFDR